MRCNCGLGGTECDFCHIQELEEQLATVTAQRDALLRAAKHAEAFVWGEEGVAMLESKVPSQEWVREFHNRRDSLREAIARAQSGQTACNGPVGINGQRDPDHPCDMFRYGKPSERNTCEGDGHYLCNECGHYRCDPPEQSGQPKKLTTHDDLRAAGVENHDVGRTCFHCGGDVPSGFRHEHADGACKQSGQPAQRDDNGTASGGGQP